MDPPLIRANSAFVPTNHCTDLKNFDFDSSDSKMMTKMLTIPIPIPKQKRQSQQIHRRRESSRRSVLENYANFKRSAAPARVMYIEEGTWKEFSAEVVELAKSAFEVRNAVVEVRVDGTDYLIDFFRMLQIDVTNGSERSVAWIDVNGKCFFPKFFVDDDVEHSFENSDCRDRDCDGFKIPKIVIEVKVDDSRDLTNGRRKRGGDEVDSERDVDDTAISSYSGCGGSKRRLLDDVDVGKPRWLNARLIGEEEKAYSAVRDLFMAGMKGVGDAGVEITSIHQFSCAGPKERARWEVFHKNMEIVKNARGSSNTVFAWFGAAKKDVMAVLDHGFGFPSRMSGFQAHGTGIYLSPARSPQLSHALAKEDENGERHVLLCRVTLGNVEKVVAGSQQTHPSSMSFDSGVDDVGNPKWYVVWSGNMNTHILPACVVSYKCSDLLQGHENRADFQKWVPNPSSSVVVKLFSKLGSLLPRPKLEEVKSLHRTYKGGKMEKSSFIKMLRAIAGDETLRYAICEVQDMK